MCFVVPGVQFGHPVHGALHGLLVHVAGDGVLILADRVGHRIVLVQHLVHQAVGGRHVNALVQVTCAKALVEGDDPFVSRFQTCDALQERALAGAVPGYDGGLLALLQAEGDVLEELAGTVAFGQAFDGKHVHGGAKVGICGGGWFRDLSPGSVLPHCTTTRPRKVRPSAVRTRST
jgi:hypothetical protein